MNISTVKNNNSDALTCDTLICGGGIAGLVTALELLQCGQHVYLIDRDTPERLGGLARWAFGGMALSATNEQKRMRIPDDAALLLKDWHSFADFGEDDHWPKQWAQEYAEHNHSQVYLWLKQQGLKFLPAVNWVERGLYTPGNSVPRYHVLWGTGWQLVETIIEKLQPFIKQQQLQIYYQHKVLSPLYESGTVTGIVTGVVTGAHIINEQNNTEFSINAKQVVIACGGINGSAERVKQNWYKPWGKAPESFLNGANPIADGLLHDQVEAIGGQLTHLDKMWNYAAGIPHPQAEFAGHGLSLIPCKSALWLDHQGKRIGPMPLVTGFDTNYLCEQVAKQEKPWTWQLLNWSIAANELAVSGSAHNPSIRNKKLFTFLKEILFGNHRLIKQLEQESEEFISADSIESLADKMNALTDQPYINAVEIKQLLADYDQQFSNKAALQNDDQIRRIQHARQWRPDRLRTSKPGPIAAKNRGKFIAIKLQLISRKSLGGLQTNLQSQVLNSQGEPITGLYCVGEAAGFGGGGANGFRALEGTFLSACILTARNAAAAILSSGSEQQP